MRLYDYNLITNLALLDLPKQRYYQAKQKDRYWERIWRQLLVYDQLPDDDYSAVLNEARQSLETIDPAFDILFYRTDFEEYIQGGSHLAKWQKIKKDYYYFIEQETKRRNKENPYHPSDPSKVETWDELPDFSKGKQNLPYQFDHLYRDSQHLERMVHELTKEHKNIRDKDLFRAKVNSILVPDKIIFALNSSDTISNFVEMEISVMNIKVSLDAYKLAHVFLNRLVESLHKIRWSKKSPEKEIDSIISSADMLLAKLNNRISEIERRFMLYISSSSEE